MPQVGAPAMKDLVPSIGSITQLIPEVPLLFSCSYPIMPSSGKLDNIALLITSSVLLSAKVTGSNLAVDLLSTTRFFDLKYFRASAPPANATCLAISK